MKLTQAGLNTVLNLVASIAATVLPLLVDQHVITAQLASIIGGVVTAVVSGWHGNAAVANLQAKRAAAKVAA